MQGTLKVRPQLTTLHSSLDEMCPVMLFFYELLIKTVHSRVLMTLVGGINEPQKQEMGSPIMIRFRVARQMGWCSLKNTEDTDARFI